MSSAVIRQPNFAALLGAAWLLSVLQLTAAPWDLAAVNLVDGDDALRLLQVRDFVAGQGWFDLHQSRLGPPLGYDSHWSRLIDVGLASFISVFNAFADRGVAESLTLIVWPVLWLLPTMGGVAAITWRLAGRQAAIIALLLCAFGLPGFQQFKPGRIDHHNVQIALAMLVVAATVWSDRLRWTAWAAGALTGLALAIGLESLPFLALSGVAFALRYTFDRHAAPALRDYGLSLSIGTLVAFIVSVAPGHWLRGLCDQIAINYAAAVVAGALGLIMAARHFADERGLVRWTAAAAAGGGALVVFALLEPRCLAGPFALIDPKIVPIFFTNVAEMQSLPYLLRTNLSAGVATVAFPAAALLAAFMMALRSVHYRDFGFLMASAACLVACAVTIVAFKGYPYAMWFGVPLVAAAAFYFFNWLKLTSLVPRFVAVLMVTPMTISFAALSITAAASHNNVFDKDSTGRQACVRKENYELLARLPAGLIVANELEWGPYLLLWTPHSILGGPYHRLSDAIVMTHQAFTLAPEEAHAVLTRIHADYLVTCGSRGAAGLRDEQRAASLWGRLRASELPEWLEQVAGTERQAFTVYRVKPRS